MAKMLVRAVKLGYYDHKRRYPAGELKVGAGEPFEVGEDALRPGKGGDFLRGQDGNPVLPRWVEPAGPWPIEWQRQVAKKKEIANVV